MMRKGRNGGYLKDDARTTNDEKRTLACQGRMTLFDLHSNVYSRQLSPGCRSNQNPTAIIRPYPTLIMIPYAIMLLGMPLVRKCLT